MKNVPEIRFNGYDGEWSHYMMVDIASFSKGKGYSKSDLQDEGNPIILYGRMYTAYSPIIEDVDTYTLPKEGSLYSNGNEVIIPGSGETPEDISVASAVTQRNVILGGDLNVLIFQERFLPAFMAMCITNSKTHLELSSFAQGKTIVHLRNSDIAKGHLFCPAKTEQKKVVDYIQCFDNQIKNLAAKLASLKQVKAASLQAMFPQGGATVPKLRFKGFDGEWKKKTIADICTKKTSMLSESNLGPSFGNYAVFGASGYIQNIPSFDMKTPYVGIIKDGSGVGRSRLYPAFSSLLGTMQYILPKDCCEVSFLACLFESINFTSFVNGSSIPHIYFRDYADSVTLIPELKEQETIGHYFYNLDKQISLQSQRLEKLKQIKAACLDKMFV